MVYYSFLDFFYREFQEPGKILTILTPETHEDLLLGIHKSFVDYHKELLEEAGVDPAQLSPPSRGYLSVWGGSEVFSLSFSHTSFIFSTYTIFDLSFPDLSPHAPLLTYFQMKGLPATRPWRGDRNPFQSAGSDGQTNRGKGGVPCKPSMGLEWLGWTHCQHDRRDPWGVLQTSSSLLALSFLGKEFTRRKWKKSV